MFSSMYSAECRTCRWDDIASMITGGSLKEDTEKYRYFSDNGFSKEAQSMKHRMPAFTPAVECRGGRKAEHFAGLTLAGMCDFDHVENAAEAFRKAAADSHSLLVYRTVSGNGVRVIFRYRLQADTAAESATAQSLATVYAQAFAVGNRYYETLLGAKADWQCKNLGRLSVVCHDAEAAFNNDCEPLIICGGAQAGGNAAVRLKRGGRRPLLANAVQAVAERLKADGVEYAPGTYNRYVSRTGYYLNMLGISEPEATEWAVSRFADYEERDVRSIMKSCYTHTGEFGRMGIASIMRQCRGKSADKRREPRRSSFASVSDIEAFLKEQATFRFNIITRKTETDFGCSGHYRELTDRDENTLWTRMCKQGVKAKGCDIHSVLCSEFVPEWNPFKEYFNSLPEWDGRNDYIGELAAMVSVKPGNMWNDTDDPQALFDTCFRKWLVGMVATLLDPDVVNNVILVLIGRQGIYKTTFFNYLLPEVLRPYFYTKTNSDTMSKDDRLSLAEYAIICLEEIDSMRTPELNQLKALVTTRSINERAAYSRHKENRVHIASFCGTGNNTQFLTDPTGNRRWLPFEVTGITDPRTTVYNYEGIYSQAVALWRGGMTYWFNNSEISAMARHISNFEVPNLEEELIATYYRVPREGEQYVMVNATNIIEHINIFIKRALSAVKVGIAMRKLGFSQRHTGQGRMYMVVVKSNKTNAAS